MPDSLQVVAAEARAADTGGASPASGLPEYVTRGATGFYRWLNPATKLELALVEVVVAFTIPGWVGPGVVLALVVAVGVATRNGRELFLIGLATLPLVVSITIVNLFLLPGATDAIVRVGPLAPTWSGLGAALLTSARLIAFSSAVALAYLTTPVDDLLADMSRRGLGRGGVFVVGAAVRMVPRTLERAAEIMDAQRARGLDTEGRIWRRARGIFPLAAPLVFGALSEVEERTMALEARAFRAPGRPTLLRIPADRPIDRLLRWLGLGVVVLIVAARLAGVVR